MEACLKGDEQAWSDLIDKYKRLIYSIPVKYRIPTEDAADIFQAVCVELFTDLPKLRKVESLAKWLITVTDRASLKWKQRHQAAQAAESGAAIEEVPAAGAHGRIAEEAEHEQRLRDAIAQLSPRCQVMIRMLFFEHPPVPYEEVARRLGVATGSIGFLRGRCLARLRKILEQTGSRS